MIALDHAGRAADSVTGLRADVDEIESTLVQIRDSWGTVPDAVDQALAELADALDDWASTASSLLATIRAIR